MVRNDFIELAAGDRFHLDLDLGDSEGDIRGVGLEYEPLCSSVVRGDILLLDDGRIRLRVDNVEARAVECSVLIGGALGSRKGINRLGGGLAAPALTAKDLTDIDSLSAINPDFVAVSFVSTAEDIFQTRERLQQHDLKPAIIAKIERAEVVADQSLLNSIVIASDGVMVARGDLGVEVGDAQLIGIQKELISLARIAAKPVITATQMMESMISSSMPTRAEVFDVANAVLDGTDAVMLSAETAVGGNRLTVTDGRCCAGVPFKALHEQTFDLCDQSSLKHKLRQRYTPPTATVTCVALPALPNLAPPHCSCHV